VPRLVLHGLRRRSWLRIDAALEQLIPPLSVPFALGAVSVPAALLFGSVSLTAIALGCLAGYALYLVSALALVRAPGSAYAALAAAPLYITWKLWLYTRALSGAGASEWVRTARTPNVMSR
jgi:1,2-diacylglycerol 3-beta-glucosyltransferase